ncbi:MAG: hypothetical protein U0235_19120 [Polyangiaceae bacterium]
MTKHFGFLLGSLGVSAVLMFAACDATDEAAGTPTKPGSTTDATVITDGQTSDAPTKVDGLCARAGGIGAVSNIADQIYAKAAADCRIGAYFTALDARSSTHVHECMRKQLEEIFACPGITYAGSKSSSGDNCRSMQNAHDGLRGPDGKSGINKADFQAYREVATAALKAGGLSDDDVTKVNSVFLGYENQVEQSNVETYNSNCTCANGVAPGSGASCVPEGGYILPDASVPDVGTDTGTDTGTPDTGSVVDAADDGG